MRAPEAMALRPACGRTFGSRKTALASVRPDQLANALNAVVDMLAPLGHALGKSRLGVLVAGTGLRPAGAYRFDQPFGNGGIIDVARFRVLVDDEFRPAIDLCLEPAFQTGLQWTGPFRNRRRVGGRRHRQDCRTAEHGAAQAPQSYAPHDHPLVSALATWHPL